VKRMKSLWAVGIFLAAALIVWAGMDKPSNANVALLNSMPASMDTLEPLIPFAIRVASAPAPQCDPLDVELIVVTDSGNQEMVNRWRVMDGQAIQMEFEDFHDLYYRCDAPSCLDLRVVRMDGRTGKIYSSRQGHVCLE
jgi:hypothetical protein